MFLGKDVLHVGCGGSPFPTWLVEGANETRLDIDCIYSPDIIADMRDFVTEQRFDAIYCSHALEHLYDHEVVPTLKNFLNHLKDGGFSIVVVPNLSGITATDEVVYESPSGPVTGRDMIYGRLSPMEKMPYMAHHTGFVEDTLKKKFEEAGYKSVKIVSDIGFNLIAVGAK